MTERLETTVKSDAYVDRQNDIRKDIVRKIGGISDPPQSRKTPRKRALTGAQTGCLKVPIVFPRSWRVLVLTEPKCGAWLVLRDGLQSVFGTGRAESERSGFGRISSWPPRTRAPTAARRSTLAPVTELPDWLPPGGEGMAGRRKFGRAWFIPLKDASHPKERKATEGSAAMPAPFYVSDTQFSDRRGSAQPSIRY